jgi:hypothetical protein
LTDETIAQSVLFPDIFLKPLVAQFDQPHASSDGGAILLKAADARLGLTAALAGCLTDGRTAEKIAHTLHELVAQRVFGESGFEEVIITGRSGDGGIDGIGILQVNALVSFKVLFQCKRYTGSVTPSQLRDFRGAMMGRADKGIMITTGSFTSDARKEAVRDGVPPIDLVDGEELVTMLEQLELGLKPRRTFEVDEAFFDQFRK